MADFTYEIIHQHYANSTATEAAVNDGSWFYEGAGGRIGVNDGGSFDYFYPSSYVDSGFIKNQNSSSQTANFDITGDGTFGGTVTAGQVTSTGIMANNLGILSGVSYSVGNSDDGQYVNKSFASTTKNSATAVEFDINLSSMTINAGGSNSNTVFNMFRCDTVNTSTTGVTVRLAELMYGGSSKFRVGSNGYVYSNGGHYLAFGVGNIDAANYEVVTMFHDSGAAGIAVTAQGTGVVRDFSIITGADTGVYVGTDGLNGIRTASPETSLHVGLSDNDEAAISYDITTTTPSNPATSKARHYIKGGLFVIQYNDASTIRYKYLDLAGTGVTWVHTTSAP